VEFGGILANVSFLNYLTTRFTCRHQYSFELQTEG